MVKTINIFQKVGFVQNPFSPYGVTRSLNQDYPPPVGVQHQLNMVKKELEKSVNYEDNMMLLVVGEYGSGKSELLKFFHRYFEISNKQSYYTRYSETKLSLISAIRTYTQYRRKSQERIFIFIDEIDDIPRWVEEKSLTPKDVSNFLQEIRDFIEPQGNFKDETRITLVLGLGEPSFNEINKNAYDVAQRLKNSVIFLKVPEQWQLTGFIRRNLYFYSTNELREKLTESPYFPFSEGIVLSLTRLSAISHELKTLNPRFIFQLFDGLIFYYCDKISRDQESKTRVFNVTDVFDLLKDPEKFEIKNPTFIENAKKLGDLIDSEVEKRKRYINISEANLKKLIIFFFLNHIPFDKKELLNYLEIEPTVLDRIVEIYVNSKIIEKVYTPKTTNFISKSELETQLSSCGKDDSFIKKFLEQIFEKEYDIRIDPDLAKNKYNILLVPNEEYLEELVISEEKFKILSKFDFWKKYNSGFTEKFRISRNIWDEFISNSRIVQVRENLVDKVKREMKTWDQKKIQDQFKHQFRIFLNDESNFRLLTNFTSLDLLVLETPSILFLFLQQPKDQDQSFIKMFEEIKKSKMNIEAICIFVSDIYFDEVEKFEDSLKKGKEFVYPNEEYEIPIFFEKLTEDEISLIVGYESVKPEIKNLREQKGHIFEILKEWQNKIEKDYENNGRILFNKKFNDKDLKDLLKNIESLWKLIISPSEKTKVQQEIDAFILKIKKIDERFVFDPQQYLSKIEIMVMQLIKKKIGIQNDILLSDFENYFSGSFSQTYSRFSAQNSLSLLELKGILEKLPKKKWRIKNKKHFAEKFDNRRYSALKKSVESSINEYKFEFLSENFVISYSKMEFKELWGKYEEFLSKYDNLIKDIDVLVNTIFDTQDNQAHKDYLNKEKEIDSIFEEISKLEKSITEKKILLQSNLEKFKGIVKEFLNEIKKLEENFSKKEREDLQKELKQCVSMWNSGEIKKSIEKLTDLKIQFKSSFEDREESIAIRKEIRDSLQQLPLINNIISSLKSEIDNNTWKLVLTTDYYSSQSFIDFQKSEKVSRFEISNFLNEIPNQIKFAREYKNWILPLIKKYDQENLETLTEIKKDLLKKYESFFNCTTWLYIRSKGCIWDLIKQNIDEIVNQYKSFEDKKGILTRKKYLDYQDIREIFEQIQKFETFFESLFKEHWRIIFYLTENGKGKPVDYNCLALFKIRNEEFELIIQPLVEHGLFQRSIMT